MDWSVLGIGPTKDKKAITAAYRKMLRQTNPEDHPEGFKALRAAYEEALALADRNDTDTARDESPVGLWMEAVSAIYQDHAARIDPEQWKRLLRADVCIALDQRHEAETALLTFLMDHFFLPRSVWMLLDQTFLFSQRTQELYESYPREFIDHVILDGPRTQSPLPYELFTPGIDGAACDAYRELYFRWGHTEPSQWRQILEQMDALSERHPYGEALRFRFWMDTGKEDAGKEGLEALARAYPDDAHVALAWAGACLVSGDPQEAERIASKILTTDPDHISARSTLAQCFAQQGRYHEAKELLYELIHACGGDPVMMDGFTRPGCLRCSSSRATA